MRFVADLTTSESPVERTARAIGAAPVLASGRWSSAGLEIAHWRMSGPHHFSYGQQFCHCVAFVHKPLENHLLLRNNKVIRQGRVNADRFRLSVPGDEIDARVTTPDRIEMTHFYLSQTVLETLADDMEIPFRPLQLQDPTWDSHDLEIESAMRLMHLSINSAGFSDWARLELLALYAVSTLLRGVSAAARASRTNVKTAKRINRAIQFVNENFDKPVQLADIARAACVSQFHLCRIFREATGMSPHAFLRERRLTEANRLLHETGYGLDEIAYRTGFASAGSLAGAVRRRFGTGPARLRRA